MIVFPFKRVWGVIGATRSGKDSVAAYLKETRNFTPLAFSDQIKEEFGISKEEFEAAKNTNRIEALRKELWDFTARIKQSDPLHFVRGVMGKIEDTKTSVIVTDIRTEDELAAFCKYRDAKLYRIIGRVSDYENGFIAGSKLSHSSSTLNSLIETGQMKMMNNTVDGLFYFYQYLDQFFYKEDIEDLFGRGDKKTLRDYLAQFNVTQRNNYES